MPGQSAELSAFSHNAYPITQQAFDVLSREIEELEHAVRDEHARGFSASDDAVGSPLAFPGQTTASKVKRLTALRDVLANAQIVRSRNVAAIGRRVTIREPDGTHECYTIVFPGDGDPRNGWVSADSPIGVALLWALTGQQVVVQAPAGPRPVRILGVEAPERERLARAVAMPDD